MTVLNIKNLKVSQATMEVSLSMLITYVPALSLTLRDLVYAS